MKCKSILEAVGLFVQSLGVDRITTTGPLVDLPSVEDLPHRRDPEAQVELSVAFNLGYATIAFMTADPTSVIINKSLPDEESEGDTRAL